MPDRTISDRGPITREAPGTQTGGAGLLSSRAGDGRAVVTDAGPETGPTLWQGFGLWSPNKGAEGGSPFVGGVGTYGPGGLIQAQLPAPAPGNQTGIVNSGPIYGDDSPFEILADLALRMFGNDDSGEKQGPVVVGDAGFAQSSSSGGLIIVVLLAGGAIAFYYWRKRNAGN